MKHLLRVAVVIGLLSGVWRAEADTAMVYFYDAEEPLRNGCVGAGFPPFGDPLPDGTAIYIVWDWNANGFDYGLVAQIGFGLRRLGRLPR